MGLCVGLRNFIQDACSEKEVIQKMFSRAAGVVKGHLSVRDRLPIQQLQARDAPGFVVLVRATAATANHEASCLLERRRAPTYAYCGVTHIEPTSFKPPGALGEGGASRVEAGWDGARECQK